MTSLPFERMTALVSGASSGIGRCFAEALAQRGCHLILTARSGDALQQLAAQLQAQHGIRVLVIAADLAQAGAAAALYAEVTAAGWTVDLLVNNAGFGKWRHFLDEDADTYQRMLMLNIVALTELTRLLLPAMQARRLGAVINVASTAAFQPLPYIAVYGASKAYVLHLTEALAAEYEGSGVRFLALCPGNTRTRFTEVANADVSGMAAASPESVVASALRALDAGRHYLVPGRMNYLTAQLPRWLTRRQVTRLVMALFAKRIMPKVS